MQTVQIPRPIYDSMVAHARAGFPNEICGIILGPPGEMREVYPVANAAADPLYTYDMEGHELFRVTRLADENDWQFVAIYHSHPPFAEVYPSATDIAKAFYPDAIYIILAIGQIPVRYREQLRDPQKRATRQKELGDPQTLPPRMRAFRIIKDDWSSKEGQVTEVQIEIA